MKRSRAALLIQEELRHNGEKPRDTLLSNSSGPSDTQGFNLNAHMVSETLQTHSLEDLLLMYTMWE